MQGEPRGLGRGASRGASGAGWAEGPQVRSEPRVLGGQPSCLPVAGVRCGPETAGRRAPAGPTQALAPRGVPVLISPV